MRKQEILVELLPKMVTITEENIRSYKGDVYYHDFKKIIETYEDGDLLLWCIRETGSHLFLFSYAIRGKIEMTEQDIDIRRKIIASNDRFYKIAKNDIYEIPKERAMELIYDMPSLKKFTSLLRTKIRKNLMQSAGWLIVIGLFEYRKRYNGEETHPGLFDCQDFDEIEPGYWQVGAYEPTTSIHGDIEFKYIVDIETATIECMNVETGLFEDVSKF